MSEHESLGCSLVLVLGVVLIGINMILNRLDKILKRLPPPDTRENEIT